MFLASAYCVMSVSFGTGFDRRRPPSQPTLRESWEGPKKALRCGAVPAEPFEPGPLPVAHAFDIEEAKERLSAARGGYEVVHRSPGLEVGVYVLVAPEPDRQQPHEDDEVYVVLEGRGTLDVEGRSFPVSEGDALFVEAGADHRFTGYESLSV